MSRVAVVTGGTRGIGAAISKALKAAGCRVAATYHTNDEAAAKFKAETGIHVYKWNVTNYDDCVVESCLQAHHAAHFEIPTKQTTDELRLIFDDMEGAVFDPIAERNRSAHPDALPLGGGDFVADLLARDLALELGEGQQHVRKDRPAPCRTARPRDDCRSRTWSATAGSLAHGLLDIGSSLLKMPQIVFPWRQREAPTRAGLNATPTVPVGPPPLRQRITATGIV